MPKPLFSNFGQRENRITAIIMATFERLSFALMEQIMQTLIAEPERQLLSFQNQPFDTDARPDARIGASFSYWIETKIRENAIDIDQIKRHLLLLNKEQNVEIQRLLILTPDKREPNIMGEIEDNRVVWVNFENLVNSIKEVLSNEDEWITSNRHVPTDREREFLKELVRLLDAEKLIGSPGDQVIVVPARIAWGEYKNMNAYICQPNRVFRQAQYIAFYENNVIHKEIPFIEKVIDNITLSEEAIKNYESLDLEECERLLNIIEVMDEYREERIDKECKIFLLSSPNDKKTLTLKTDIENDLTAEQSGRRVAFVQNQRYIPLKIFQSKSTLRYTTELLKSDTTVQPSK
jgi:hypothetical protein